MGMKQQQQQQLSSETGQDVESTVVSGA